jgi:hypothetical protein
MMSIMRERSKINARNKIQYQILIQLFSDLISEQLIDREKESKRIKTRVDLMIFENINNIFEIGLSELLLLFIRMSWFFIIILIDCISDEGKGFLESRIINSML